MVERNTSASDAPKFLTGSLMRHISVMVLSSTLGLMAVFLVDFVDLYFISLLGNQALAAAVGYSGTLLFFTTSIGVGLMIAMSALVSKRIGQGDKHSARKIASNVIFVGLICSCLFATLIFVYAPVLLSELGAKGLTHEYATRYLRIIVPSMPVMVVAFAATGLLRAHGDATRAMNVTLVAALVNAVLDPIFIFGLGLGLDGAAYATVIARLTMAFMAVLPVVRHYGGFAQLSWAALRIDLWPIGAIAIPAVLTNIATPVGFFFVTRTVAQFGDSAVAGYAVVGRLTPIAFGVLFALSGAIGPIVGQNFGAGNIKRVRETVFNSLAFAAGCTLIAWVCLVLSWRLIADIFGVEGDGRDVIRLFCLVVAPVYYFNGVIFVANAAFNNLNRAVWSTMMNWGRNTLGTIPFVLIGASLLNAPGVLIGQALGGVVFAVLGVYLLLRLCRTYAHEEFVQRDAVQPSLHRQRPDTPFTTPRA